MRRALPWFLAVAAAVAVVWFATTSETGSDAVPSDDGADEAGAATAALAGRGGVARASPAAAPEAVRITGFVVGESGAGLSGVAVVVRPRSERVAAGEPLARVVSGPRGTFALDLPDRDGSFEIRAVPAPPLIGTARIVDASEASDPVLLFAIGGAALDVEVVGASGAAVAATLSAEGTWAEWETLRVGPFTALDGRFRLEGLNDGVWRLDVESGGLAFSRSVSIPHAGRLRIVVPTAGTVAGTVRDVLGAPQEGLEVHVETRVLEATAPGESSATAITDANGAFAISVAPGTLERIRAERDDVVVLEERTPVAPWAGTEIVAGETRTIDLVTAGSASVRGIVREEGTGTPLAGARVWLVPAWHEEAAPETLEATADANGAFVFSVVPAGRHVLLASTPEHYLPELALPIPERDYDEQPVVQVPAALFVGITGPGTIERDLVLHRGHRVSGRVVDDEDRPVEGARVERPGPSLAERTATWRIGWSDVIRMAQEHDTVPSDADGRFVAGGLAAPPWSLVASKEGWVGISTFVRETDARESVLLRMRRGGVLRGRVVDQGGAGVAGASVWSAGEGDEYDSYGDTTTSGPDGRFEILGAAPGTSEVHAESALHLTRVVPIEPLALGETREGIEITVERGVRISGVVVDAGGRGLSGRSLEIEAGETTRSTKTGPAGAFVVDGLPRGMVEAALETELRHGPSGGSWWSSSGLGAPFEAPAEGVRLVLDEEDQGAAAIVLHGRVVGPDDEPIPFCLVSAGYDWQPYVGEAVDGRFRFVVSGHEFPIVVRASSPRGRDGETLDLASGEATVSSGGEPVVIRLAGGRTVTGRVLDDRERGLPDVVLAAGHASATTDAQGEFRLQGLPEGDVKLVVAADPRFVEAAPLEIRAGESSVTITLEHGVVLEGVVQDESGAPLAAGVSARWARAGVEGERSGYASGGRLRLQGIPPGVLLQVEVRANRDGVVLPTAVVEGVRSGTRDLVVRVASGFAVEGVVVDEAGRPVAEAWVQHAEERYGGSPDAAGRFRFRFADRGAKVLFARKDDVEAAPVEVIPPATDVVIRLVRGETISGVVVGENAGGFGVGAVWASRPDPLFAPNAEAETDEDGRFVLGPFAGPVQLVARRFGDSRYAMSPPLEPGTREVRLALREGTSIAGVLLDAEGKPMKGSVIILGELVVAYPRSDAQGRFEAKGLPPGTYRVGPHVWGQSPDMTVEAGTTDVVVRTKE